MIYIHTYENINFLNSYVVAEVTFKNKSKNIIMIETNNIMNPNDTILVRSLYPEASSTYSYHITNHTDEIGNIYNILYLSHNKESAYKEYTKKIKEQQFDL